MIGFIRPYILYTARSVYKEINVCQINISLKMLDVRCMSYIIFQHEVIYLLWTKIIVVTRIKTMFIRHLVK